VKRGAAQAIVAPGRVLGARRNVIHTVGGYVLLLLMRDPDEAWRSSVSILIGVRGCLPRLRLSVIRSIAAPLALR